MHRVQIIILLIIAMPIFGYGQNFKGKLTLNEAIEIAHQNSPRAQMVELSFMSQYWNFRSYKAQLLPSINLNGNIGNYNRSVVEARDPETGEINYVSNNTLSNDLSLSIDQKIALTGGSVSLNTSLARLDQFTYDNTTLNSNPITISYNQPLRSFNALKWQKKTAPLQYENAKRTYLESMENITIQTTNYFFAVLSAQTTLKNSLDNYNDTKEMFEIAKKRFEIATVTKSELLQLELSLLNSDMNINDSKMNLQVAIFNFKFYLGIPKSAAFELIPPTNPPNIKIDYDFVLEMALANSSHQASQKIKELNAEKSVAQAKANRGIQMQLNANVGFSQTDDNVKDVYKNLRDREVVGLRLSMPIYDWGMSRGRVKMAEAELDLIETEIEQEEVKFRQDIMIKVLEFNNQMKQCVVSLKAKEIATERYEITKIRFQNGGISVTELNTAQGEMDYANNRYISQLRSFWGAYYDLQKTSLYDYIRDTDINAEFDKIIEN